MDINFREIARVIDFFFTISKLKLNCCFVSIGSFGKFIAYIIFYLIKY